MLSLPASFTSSSPPLPKPRLPSAPRRCSSPGRHFRAGSGWDSNAEAVRTGRFRFIPKDEFVTDDEDDGYGDCGFRSSAKQRVWWSEESSDFEDDEEMLRAIGWMLPAIIISLVLGTGSNALFMALALPLGQSALSLVIDKLWGSTSSSPRPRPTTKKKPFARRASSSRTDEEKREENINTNREKGSYRSWNSANDASVKKGAKTVPSYGGWDDLDKHSASKASERVQTRRVDGPQRQQRKGKLSRRRNRDAPLLLRLMLAVFPFLGFWTKLL
ncbi:uncharacterized protein LOC131153382 isoform X2 [Malania oleifera]|uniref:uncharacterized protein LOC131153382 isoform X2 n=1 Tax=Malania oleifera TaxID=397392 RepID=UPI0025ADC081|nr:uncharacterized protein LOC131153382 isoform X2 [Malania oleifera]